MTDRNLRTIIYLGFASFGFIALRFLFVPVRIKLLTSLLDKGQYGTLTLVSLSVSCLTILFALGSLEFIRSKCPGKPESYQYGALWTGIRVGTAAVAIFVVPIMLLLILWQPAKVELETPDYLIIGALVPLTLNIVQRVNFLMGRQKFVSARLSQLLYADAWFLPIIPFCFFGALSVRTVLWVWLCWMILTAMLTHKWVGMEKLWKIKIARIPTKEMLFFGLPLLPMMMGDLVFQLQDRYVLLWLMGPTAVANYSLCLNIAMIGYMVGLSLIEIFSSELFRLANETENADLPAIANQPKICDLLQLMLRYGLIVTLPVAAALTACGESVILVLSNSRFLDTVPLLAWTAPIAVLFVSYFVLGRVLMAVNRGIHLGVATIMAATLNIVLNTLLVPAMDEKGTALATCISLLVLNIAVAWLVRLPRWLPLSSLQPLRMASLYLLCAGGLHLLQVHLSGHNLVILALGAVWCLVVLFALGMVRRKDVMLMRQCLESKSSKEETP
jgi:O-antigen/teichoic acid export membrane protein